MSGTAPTMTSDRPAGLPVEMTSFVGRRRELSEVRHLLSQSRLVTLTGVGGVGKTRLALRVARETRRAFDDGVWFVQLAELHDPRLLVQVVTEALGIRDVSSRPAMDVLIEHLSQMRALIVVDNCEHLLDDCGVLVAGLLGSLPDLRVLVTSRQPLGIPGEQTLAVPTLLPDADSSAAAGAALVDSDAVRLFAERAREVCPGFTITSHNREAVGRICRRLDGIPLAIELAAVRLRALSVHQLLDRLDDRFRLLTAGSRHTLPRHRTLRALIDWSYGLCSAKEQLLWARTSVFAGGLDLAAAEEVCPGKETSREEITREEIIDLVTALVEKSILARAECGATIRYRLLETIRQYGRARLVESGEEAAVRRRHRDYYGDLSHQARAHLFDSSAEDWFARLKLEHANLRAALEFCFADAAEVPAGLTIATNLAWHWATNYRINEGRYWLDRGLAAHTERSNVRARALWANGFLTVHQADTVAATRMLGESKALGEDLGDESVLAYVAHWSGFIALARGDVESAVRLGEEAVARHRVVGDHWGLAIALMRLSIAYSAVGNPKSARATGEECLTLCDTCGAEWAKLYPLVALSFDAFCRGETRRAEELTKDSLRHNRSIGISPVDGINMELLAWIATAEGHYARAARLLGSIKTICQTMGVRSASTLPGVIPRLDIHDKCEATAREALGESAYHDAFERGTELSEDAALAHALHEDVCTEKTKKPTQAPGFLTRREMEVARLVARGLSNKEIATSLTISQRTAETHVEHILKKLGFTSRAQIASWVSGQDQLTDHGTG